MIKTKFFRICCSFVLSLFITQIPTQVIAADAMISTVEVVNEMTRKQAEEKVQSVLTNEKIREALKERGLSPDEVDARLANLSDHEMKQLAGQIEQARYGGDILVTVLIIVLIIFLIKRI